MNSLKNKKRGFTLTEILVSAGIMALIMGGIATLGSDIFKTSGSIQSSLQAQQDGRNLLRQMSSELRTSSQSNTGAYPIAEAGDNRLHFYSDTNGDSLKEEIIYYLSADSKTLLKDVRIPTNVPPLQYIGAFKTSTVVRDLANGANPVFSYYDTNYDGTTLPMAQPVNINTVRLIKATITIERDPNRSPTPIIVTTQTSLRNLKDNL